MAERIKKLEQQLAEKSQAPPAPVAPAQSAAAASGPISGSTIRASEVNRAAMSKEPPRTAERSAMMADLAS